MPPTLCTARIQNPDCSPCPHPLLSSVVSLAIGSRASPCQSLRTLKSSRCDLMATRSYHQSHHAGPPKPCLLVDTQLSFPLTCLQVCAKIWYGKPDAKYRLPPADASRGERTDFIQAKYIDKRCVMTHCSPCYATAQHAQGVSAHFGFVNSQVASSSY